MLPRNRLDLSDLVKSKQQNVGHNSLAGKVVKAARQGISLLVRATEQVSHELVTPAQQGRISWSQQLNSATIVGHRI